MVYGPAAMGRAARKPVRLGCSGWQYADWRGAFYPDGLPQRRWLEHYATVFDTVEVNTTFYRLPKADAVARSVAGGDVEETPAAGPRGLARTFWFLDEAAAAGLER